MLRLVIGAAFAAALCDAAAAQTARPFVSDGCSGGMSFFFRLVTGRPPAWERCCYCHDRAYWRGGSADTRARADRRLFRCVLRTGHPEWAAAMLVAVKAAGGMFYAFDWRLIDRDFATARFYYVAPSQ